MDGFEFMSAGDLPQDEKPEPKSSKLTPFDYVKNINGKSGLIDAIDVQSTYDPFIVNRTFSNMIDTALLANELNAINISDKLMHYHFLYFVIDRKVGRFGKWNKSLSVADSVNIIQEVYGYSRAKAEEVSILFDEQAIEMLRDKIKKGGLANGKSRRS